MRGSRLPRQATQTTRPLGSGTIAASACSVRAAKSPPAPVDSSSVTVLTIRSPASGTPSSARAQAAMTMLATPPFMSHAPAPVEAAVADHGGERVGLRPVGERLDLDDVDVAVEQQRPPAAAAAEARDELRAALERELVGHHRVRPQRGRVGLVQLDLGAVGAQQGGEVLLQRALLRAAAPRPCG